MMPIVDGLKQDYNGRVEFLKLDATSDGKAAFDYFKLRGHPSYVLLKPDGMQVWSAVGLQTREKSAGQIDKALF
jgi:hypothetical protein